MYSSFEEVQRLSSEDQQSLLLKGDPPERLWATWSLALSKAKSGASHFDVVNEPSSGVRLNLIVLVAAANDRATLEALAANDPYVQVRAAACQYLIRISRSKAKCDTYIESILYSSESGTVKARILSEYSFYETVFTRSLINTLVKSECPEVRSLIVGHIDRNTNHYDIEEIVREILGPALALETDDSIRERLYMLCGQALSNASLMRMFVKNDDLLFYILEMVESRKEKLLWSEIKQFVVDFSVGVQSLIMRFVDSEKDPECIHWALKLVNQVRIASDEYGYFNERDNLLNMLHLYSGEKKNSDEASAILASVEEEYQSIVADQSWEWDVEEEKAYLEILASELKKWSYGVA